MSIISAGGKVFGSGGAILSDGGGGAGVPGTVSALKLYSSGSPGHLYSVGKIPTQGSSAITGFTGVLSPSGITGSSSTLTTPFSGYTARVDYYNVPNVAQTATMKAVNTSGSSASASPSSNSATAAAYVDTINGSNAAMIGYGNSVPSGMSPLWHNGYFDFANLRDVSPGQATVPTSFVPTANAPSAPTGLGTISKFLEVTPQGNTAYAVLLNIYQDNPANGNNGAFCFTPYGYYNFLVYKVSASSGNFFAQGEFTGNYQGIITGVSGSTITDANQNLANFSSLAGITAIFDQDTGGAAGYTSNTATTITGLSGSSIGDVYNLQCGDRPFGNQINDYATYITGPNAGSFTLNQWNVVKIPLSAMGIVGLNNGLFYKAGIGCPAPSPTDVMWLCYLGWSVS